MAKLAFLGLGVMGFPMARHLVETGHDVTVYNRTSAKAKKFAAEFKSQMADSPGEAAIGAPTRVSQAGGIHRKVRWHTFKQAHALEESRTIY